MSEWLTHCLKWLLAETQKQMVARRTQAYDYGGELKMVVSRLYEGVSSRSLESLRPYLQDRN